MKQMAVNFNYVQELVRQGVIEVNHVPTQLQLADGFTKLVRLSDFMKFKTN